MILVLLDKRINRRLNFPQDLQVVLVYLVSLPQKIIKLRVCPLHVAKPQRKSILLSRKLFEEVVSLR